MFNEINIPEKYRDIKLHNMGRRPTNKYDIAALFTLCDITAGNIFEIGTWEGKTTFEIANRYKNRVVFTIDYLENELSEREQKARCKRVELCKYAKSLDNVIFFYEKSENFQYCKLDYVDLIFIDGDHSYEGVKNDSKMAIEYLRKSSYPGKKIIAWHDCRNGTFGVNKYLQELNEKYKVTLFKKSQVGFIVL